MSIRRNDAARCALGRVVNLFAILIGILSLAVSGLPTAVAQTVDQSPPPGVAASIPSNAQAPIEPVSAPNAIDQQNLPASTTPPETPVAAQATPQDAAPAQAPPTSKLFSIPARKKIAAQSTEGLQLNFTDTDIATVIGTVLGDGLGLSYTVDPQLKGTLTLQAARPLNQEEALAALETALRTQGAALVDVGGAMHVVPVKDAPKRITSLRVPNQGEPGFGIYVVPLQYVSAADMEKLLQPFSPDGGILRVDGSRNLLLLAGTTTEIATLTSVINTFDVDWLAGMATSIYPVQQVDAKTLASELAEIFSDSKSPIAGVVRIVPLARLNSLLVITSQEKYLAEVDAWIKRLDVAVDAPGRRIYVYEVQNGKADELAKTLGNILSISSTQNGATNSSGFSALSSAAISSLNGAATSQTSRSAASASNQPSAVDPESGGLKIVPSSENNALLIMASPTEYGIIERALKQLDVVPLQILIEASIAEVTLTDDLKFGLQWSYNGHDGPITFSQASNGGINQQFPGLSFLYTGKTNIQAVLNTLESITNVRVLSSPKLLVLNNREAHLQVGDQVPIATQSAVSTSTSDAPIVNSVQMMQTGVILSVIPRANNGGRIFLEVNQEVSGVVPTTTSGIDSPTVQQRKISSTISVDSGETIALGGLIKETQNNSRSGVPLLSRIPLIGALFGSTGNNKTRTELVVLFTPRIIRSSEESSRATEEMMKEFKKLKPMEKLITQMSRPAETPTR